jgi:serine protease
MSLSYTAHRLMRAVPASLSRVNAGGTMKHLRLLFALVLVAAFLLSAAAPALAKPGETVRVWVNYGSGRGPEVRQTLANANAAFHYDFPELGAYVVTLPAAALNGIQNNPHVLFVEEDPERYPIADIPSAAALETLVTQSTAQTVPYGIDMVQARDVWDSDRDGAIDTGAPTGSGIKLCIIDSGLYTAHEDFQGVSVAGYNGNLPWNTDGFGHGTHVAGTVTAMNNALGVVGVTPGTVSLYIVRVFGDDGAWAYSSTLVDALSRCRSAQAKVVSMSLGGSRASTTERTAFANAYAAGVLSVAAAGNAGTSAYSYPASYDSVISVAAIDSNKVVASFSQYNSQVELAAPGVGVLSTLPYLETNTLTVGGTSYGVMHIEYSAYGSASGALVSGGLCDSTGAWSGKVVLCQRGVISFYDKVHNVQLGGGAAAVIYNNEPGNFLGTLGAGYSSTIVGLSLSQEDGQYLLANKLGADASVSSTLTKPASGYEAWDGTSMATPHVSAVAALVWSANPSWTNVETRQALQATAQDLGVNGKDNYYGYGLVQAKAALTYLGGGAAPTPTPTATNTPTPVQTSTPTATPTSTPVSSSQLAVTVATNKSTYVNKETVTITVTVEDQSGAAVSSASVTVVVTGANGAKTTLTGTTGTAGTASVSYRINTAKSGKGTYSIAATASKAGYTSGTGSTTFTVI